MTGDEFIRGNCIEDSALVVPLYGSEVAGANNRIPGKSSVGRVQINGIHGSLSLQILFDDGSNLLSLPFRMMQEIHRAIGIVDPVRAYERIRFHGCQSAMTRFPFVDISFAEVQRGHNQGNVGNLRINPEDYVRDLGGDLCELMIVPGSRWLVDFNPLLLPDINIRTTTEILIICDANSL